MFSATVIPFRPPRSQTRNRPRFMIAYPRRWYLSRILNTALNVGAYRRFPPISSLIYQQEESPGDGRARLKRFSFLKLVAIFLNGRKVFVSVVKMNKVLETVVIFKIGKTVHTFTSPNDKRRGCCHVYLFKLKVNKIFAPQTS